MNVYTSVLCTIPPVMIPRFLRCGPVLRLSVHLCLCHAAAAADRVPPLIRRSRNAIRRQRLIYYAWNDHVLMAVHKLLRQGNGRNKVFVLACLGTEQYPAAAQSSRHLAGSAGHIMYATARPDCTRDSYQLRINCTLVQSRPRLVRLDTGIKANVTLKFVASIKVKVIWAKVKTSRWKKYSTIKWKSSKGRCRWYFFDHYLGRSWTWPLIFWSNFCPNLRTTGKNSWEQVDMLCSHSVQNNGLSNHKLKSAAQKCTIWSQSTPVPERRTDRRMDIMPIARQFVLRTHRAL